jgi:hypothetical protein
MKVFTSIFVLAAIASFSAAALIREKRQQQPGFIYYKEGDQEFMIARAKYGEDGNFIIGKYAGDTIYIPYHGKEIAIKSNGFEKVFPLRPTGTSELNFFGFVSFLNLVLIFL